MQPNTAEMSSIAIIVILTAKLQKAAGMGDSCFEKSMNGKPLPPESKEIIALISYYQWISKGLPIYTKIPWLGMNLIKSTHMPYPANGKQVFTQQCAICHGNNGLGTLRAPPLWGERLRMETQKWV